LLSQARRNADLIVRQRVVVGGQQVNDTGTAGVIARPPLLFLGALLLGLAADRLLPWPFAVPGTDLVRWMTGGSLILVGLALGAAGIRNFSRAATPVPTNKATRVLVTTGIHGWTRNPIYLGMFLVATWRRSLARPTVPTKRPCDGGSERTSGVASSREP
jgi:protein-S-isoprenylcysteine O-methyltransferase Ste14